MKNLFNEVRNMDDEKKAKVVVLPPDLDATEIMDMTLKCWAKGRYVDFVFYDHSYDVGHDYAMLADIREYEGGLQVFYYIMFWGVTP
jgi:hypothetical protein